MEFLCLIMYLIKSNLKNNYIFLKKCIISKYSVLNEKKGYLYFSITFIEMKNKYFSYTKTV